MLYRNRRRKLSCPVKERYNLSTRACGIRTECTVVHTGGDAICKRPVNSLGIVGVAADIHEAAVASCGLTVRSPEEGHNLRARNRRIGAEGGSTGAGSDAVLNRPKDCVIVVTSVNGFLFSIGAGLPAALYRNVTTCARVQATSGLKV